MSERSVLHASFTIERTYPTAPRRVYGAWADPSLKTRWFGAGDESVQEYNLDFRVGGREHSSGLAPNNDPYSFDAMSAVSCSGRQVRPCRAASPAAASANRSRYSSGFQSPARAAITSP